jgi:hypothetical protein
MDVRLDCLISLVLSKVPAIVAALRAGTGYWGILDKQ